mmetsp:Transcript_24560/g.58469  ORF Transcript_24560/g.58469 Transcript_24560/m.58469 type:complete len:233 (+) Transcript_24560:533-1231(+)
MLDSDGKGDVGDAEGGEGVEELFRARHPARVRRHHADLLVGADAEVRDDLVDKVRGHVAEGGKVVDRRMMEETLDLAAMQVHRKHAVDASLLDHDRNVGRRDWHARRHLTVLASVSEVRHDRSDALGRGPSQAADNEEELHQVVINGRASRLDHVNVAIPDAFPKLNVDFPIFMSAHRARHLLDPEFAANLVGQLRVGKTSQNLVPGVSLQPGRRGLILLGLRKKLRVERPD